MAYKVDLNSDLGESFGAWKMGSDADVLTFVSSANVACGFHAGDPLVMKATVKEAVKAGGAVGARTLKASDGAIWFVRPMNSTQIRSIRSELCGHSVRLKG